MALCCFLFAHLFLIIVASLLLQEYPVYVLTSGLYIISFMLFKTRLAVYMMTSIQDFFKSIIYEFYPIIQVFIQQPLFTPLLKWKKPQL